MSEAYDASGELCDDVKKVVDKNGFTKYIKTKGYIKSHNRIKKIKPKMVIEKGDYILFDD